MKVISSPTEWSVDRVCPGCKVKVRITIEDVSVGIYGAAYYAGDSGEEHICSACCICGSDIKLMHAHDAPPQVLDVARDRAMKDLASY